jgi:hypothetical protein
MDGEDDQTNGSGSADEQAEVAKDNHGTASIDRG